MKFPLSWLRDHLETEAPLAQITETLSAIGLEVESVDDRAAALAPFRIARVIEAVPHPDADRLRACRVEIGAGAPVSVVCGAPNARAGMKTVFAPPGSVIPGTGVALKIGKIRGVESAGMLLSLRELGLGEDHAGIIELPEAAPVGAAYAGWAGLDDPVIEIAVTPNRGDALAVRGIARDLAAAGLGRLKPWSAPAVSARFASPLAWRIDWPEACPYVLGRSFRGLTNGPSPDWLAARLRAIGLRPINALVDITNFFTFDLGRPLHVFDSKKITGAEMVIRRGNGETLRALNNRDYRLEPEDCVIADAAGPRSLAGIMGGVESGCDEATTEMFLECALFDPVRIGQSGRRHQILSDARSRFERGIDPALLPDAVEAASRMILALCGGEASEVVGAGAAPRWQRRAALRFARLRDLGGVEIAPETAIARLAALGFALEERDAAGAVFAVPSWRNDIAAAGALDLAPGIPADRAALLAESVAAIVPEADLIEEVLRLGGLDAVPAVSLPRPSPVPGASLTAAGARAALARRVLATRGLAECVSFAFMARPDAARFGETPAELRLLNPIAADLDQLRPTPLAVLAHALARNLARGAEDVALFEIGPGFAAGFTPGGAREIAAGLRAGATPRHWAAPARAFDAFDAKADALAVLAALGVAPEQLATSAEAPAHYHPGRAGTLRLGPRNVLAAFGELHPHVTAALDIAGAVAAFEIFLDAIPAAKRRRRAAPDLSALQPVRRDFAFLVARDVPAEAVLRAARGVARGLIASVALFDVYAGEPLPAGEKSLAIEVVLQPRERALTDAEIEAISGRIVAAVVAATGARLRG